MIDQIRGQSGRSVRRVCRILEIRRQTYYSRKGGCRPEERDMELAELLRSTCARFIAWGFWMIFYFLRNEYGLKDNHKRVYRIWREAGLHLRVYPKRAVIRREYKELLAPDRINEGWAMDFVSDWVVRLTKSRYGSLILWTSVHARPCGRSLTKIFQPRN
ncbi:MAG: IS3 family transposase [Saprospiraceae bacterium]